MSEVEPNMRLADSLARGPGDLLVDLAAMTFCDVGGLALLVQSATDVAGRGIGYAVAAPLAQTRRVWADCGQRCAPGAVPHPRGRGAGHDGPPSR